MGAPRKVGNWEITSVKVVMTLPDNTTKEKDAVRTGNVWVSTIDGCETAGKVTQGYSIVAGGLDEDGSEVSGYILGKGDVFVIENRNDIKSLVDKISVRYLEDIPSTPATGDLIEYGGNLRFYDGEKWVILATGGEIPTKVSQLENDAGYITASAIPSQVSEFENDAGYITASAIPSDVSYFNNDVGYVTASAIPSQVSELDNDSGYITASAIPSNVGAFTNDVGYVTASSTEFKNKRDYDDQTFTMPSDVTLIPFGNFYDYQRWARAYVQKFDVTYDGVEHELSDFIINPEYGMMWYKPSTLFMATSDGQTFYLRDNNTNIMATTTISALKSGVVDFTYDGKSGSISMTAREKTNLALDYQTINGNLVIKANGTTVGLYNPVNPLGSEINIPVPSNVSQLNNDSGYLTAQTVAASYYSKTQVDTMLSQKQDALDEDEVTMIGQVTDERKTVITFTDNTSEEYEWSGEITRQNIVDAGLWDVDHGGWIREPLSIKVGTAVTRLGNYAFANAHYLTSIDIPSTVTSIGVFCLYDCSAMTSITIPYSMKVIGNDTFGLCSSLTSVTIPNSVESIGAAAFENCTSLSTLLIPDSVTSIGARAFIGCTSLANLKIPDNVTSIGDGAFWSSGIQNITIGSSVASIGERAFRNASSVTSVVFRGKTLAQVQAMTNYPWELDTSTISTWNDTSKEYVDGIVGTINTTLDTINGEVI